ncbi:MAG: helix-hairpin-helix domain-containing protein [Clostridia bacterium]|nr:helix-hairpin-helix domain-containing protein [Clostridia bacterium]
MIRRVCGWALAVLCAAGLLISLAAHPRPLPEAVYPVASRPPLDLSPVSRPSGSVDVNGGDAEELSRLPRIGESISALILAEREAHGFFHYPEDLLVVRGIGQATLDGFRDDLDLSTPAP